MTSKAEKALLFLLSLDKDVAADVIKQLDTDELRALREVASSNPQYDAEALDGIFKEFVEQSTAHIAFPRGSALKHLDLLERKRSSGHHGEEQP